ncbi:MAG: SRPBCC family protein [Planctomycetes bacterium]|nr:SRPBCC family protein [Planctomycetota bacterium]
MPRFTFTKDIAAFPEKVFEAAADFRGAPKRIRGILKTEVVTEGLVRLGTRFKETRKMFGKEATVTMEVVAFNPPHGYTLGAEDHGCRYRTELKFTPHAGGTRVEMNWEGTPLTFFSKMMGFLMAPMMKGMATKCVEQDLSDLKASLEGKPAAAAR